MINQHLAPIEILQIEDNPTDILLTEEALSGAKFLNHVQVVNDGMEAILFLRKEGKYADARRPHLILLDLNLPVKSGFEVLAELKADKDLRHIPIIVLSASSQQQDIFKAYDLNANCYISKPVNFRRFRSVLHAIETFWLTIAALPAR